MLSELCIRLHTGWFWWVNGLDFKGCDEAAAGPAVERAWYCFADGLNAMVNCP
jgi:hypothetical protein